MGIVARQSIKNTIYSFIGVVVGAFYTLFIVPKVFENNPEEWGIIQLFSSYVLLFMPFALLGFPNVIIKYWPGFKEKDRQGLLSFLIILVSGGLIILSLIIFLFKKHFFFPNSDNSVLINDYILYFFPYFVIHTFFYFLLYFSRVYYKTSFPTLLKDTFIKLWTFGLILSYFYIGFSFDFFFKIYFLVFVLQLIILAIYCKKVIPFTFTFNLSFFSNNKIKEILGYGFFSLLTGITSVVITRIDLFMINKYLNLEEVAFYSVGLFFITVMQIPARSIGTIVIPILSEKISVNDKTQINILYNKTTTNLFLAESIILMLILMNLDELMLILGETFGQIKYVIIILAIAKLYELVNYLNYSLIIFTRFFKYELFFQSVLLILTISSNILLIPKYGIEGAAMATGITIIINTTIRAVFVYLKYGMLPFKKVSLKIVLIVLMSFLAVYFIPFVINVYFTIALKSIIILMIYFIFSLILNISPEINTLVSQSLKILGLKK
jgi:O-antigen/teichoic acid export membrane protein